MLPAMAQAQIDPATAQEPSIEVQHERTHQSRYADITVPNRCRPPIPAEVRHVIVLAGVET